MLRVVVLLILITLPVAGSAQEYLTANGSVRIAVALNPFTGSRSGSDVSPGPEKLFNDGLREYLAGNGAVLQDVRTVDLSPAEKKQYGEWNRMGLANGHLNGIVAGYARDGLFPVGLLGNCNSLMGMLAGLQQSTARPLRVGLVWIDAHGDFNTPETTLSGMLGGMPVAVSAGMCLTRLRRQSGLDPALPTKYIVMAGLRDVDPLERELIDRSDIQEISTQDIRSLSENIHAQMRRLSRLTDVIYVHVDMDVLDPAEVPGHGLNVPDGPTSEELAAALEVMFSYDKAAAFGIASYPHSYDPDGVSRDAAYRLISGVINGLKKRNN